MKITKITKVREHRMFRNFSWPKGLHDFGQFNLIYGWNGCGKTTLSALLAQIEKKNKLTEGEAELELDAKQKVSGKQFDGAGMPPVRVFNRDYVKAAITSKDGGETEGGELAPIFYLGKKSIEKQERIGELKIEQETTLAQMVSANTAKKDKENEIEELCTTTARVIRETLTGSGSQEFNKYDKRNFKNSIGTLNSQEEALAEILSDESKEKLHRQKDSQEMGNLREVNYTVPNFVKILSDITELLDQSVVSKPIAELAKAPEIAGWVQKGLELHTNEYKTDSCRFCTQPLSTDRRLALEGHFNESFANFQLDLSSKISFLEEVMREMVLLDLPDPNLAYKHLRDDLSAARSEANLAIEFSSKWVERAKEALIAKRAAPLAHMQTGELENSIPTPDSLGSSLAKVNAIVESHNDITSNFRRAVNEACQKLERHYVAEVWDRHSQLLAENEACGAEVKRLQEVIRGIRAEIQTIERDIREYRTPAEELNTELEAYLGHNELQFEIKENGYSLSRAGNPVRHLSEGERTAIAFLYFLKSTESPEFDTASGIVVIDDPVSSLDANSLFSAFGYMRAKTEKCGQLMILTHNFGFFRQVKNWFRHLPKQRKKKIELRPARFFMLRVAADSQGRRCATIGQLDPLLEEYESEYHYLFRLVFDEAKKGGGDPSLESFYGIPNVARRLLEAFLAFKFPEFAGNFAQSLEQAKRIDAGKRARILSLLHRYSHASEIAEPVHDQTVLAETKTVLNLVLELIKAEDPTHFDAMERLAKGEEASE